MSSAGVEARAGSPACDLASAMVGVDGMAGHQSRRVESGLIGEADLILTADRTHRAALARMAPASRNRTYTMRQAAALAVVVADALATGGLPPGAPPLPDDPDSRLSWFLAELDAARGREPEAVGRLLQTHLDQVPGLRVSMDEADSGPLDIPDPHVYGFQLHEAAVATIRDAMDHLTTSLQLVLKV